MRGSVAIPPGFDLTAPVAEEPFAAERDELDGCVGLTAPG
jgi:hypothetical protein